MLKTRSGVGRVSNLWRRYRRSSMGILGFSVLLLFTSVAILATLLAPYPSKFGPPTDYLKPPTFSHVFGTNEVGQDVFALVIYGSRTSLIVGFVATIISIIIGTFVGLVAGYYSSYLDIILMRLTDIFLVLPTLVLMIIVASILGPSLINVILIIGLLGWPSAARIVRSQVLSVKEKSFIDASKVSGTSSPKIIARHILPSVAPLIFANAALVVSNSIISESVLSFFGLGDPLSISWGTILRDAFISGSMISGAYWYFLPPGIAITLVVVAFTMVGFSLDNVFNPRLEQERNWSSLK